MGLGLGLALGLGLGLGLGLLTLTLTLASVRRTCMTERKKTLTLSCTWSPTFWQSAERREVMSPVRTWVGLG